MSDHNGSPHLHTHLILRSQFSVTSNEWKGLPIFGCHCSKYGILYPLGLIGSCGEKDNNNQLIWAVPYSLRDSMHDTILYQGTEILKND